MNFCTEQTRKMKKTNREQKVYKLYIHYNKTFEASVSDLYLNHLNY